MDSDILFFFEEHMDALPMYKKLEEQILWTHHVMVGSVNEIDAELIGWIKEAAEFSSNKR